MPTIPEHPSVVDLRGLSVATAPSEIDDAEYYSAHGDDFLAAYGHEDFELADPYTIPGYGHFVTAEE